MIGSVSQPCARKSKDDIFRLAKDIVSGKIIIVQLGDHKMYKPILQDRGVKGLENATKTWSKSIGFVYNQKDTNKFDTLHRDDMPVLNEAIQNLRPEDSANTN